MTEREKLGEKSFGEKASPVIVNLGEAIFEHAENFMGEKPGYTDEALFFAGEILVDVLLDKMWEYLDLKDISQEERETIAEEAVNELRQFIIKYTGKDPRDLARKYARAQE